VCFIIIISVAFELDLTSCISTQQAHKMFLLPTNSGPH